MYHFIYTNYNLFKVTCKSLNYTHSLVAGIQKFKKLNLKTPVSNMWTDSVQ